VLGEASHGSSRSRARLRCPGRRSPPIAAVRHADGLPAPSVRARLGGRGYRRTLRYTIKTIAGQKVRFLERANGVGSELGEGKGGSCTLRFAPAEGPAASAR
jgi:hypothetical protein